MILNPSGKIHHNQTVDWLILKSLSNKEVIKSKNGAVIVYTGKYTGRSPQDKYIVDTKDVHNEIDWKTNQRMTEKTFNSLFKKVSDYLSEKNELFIFDGFAGADPEYKLQVRVISEYAYQALFSNHLLRRPTPEELLKHKPQLTILSVPNYFTDPKKDQTHSEACIAINLKKMIVIIGGTKYSGEIKKSIFTVMNAILPEKNVLPMHCSANIGKDGKTALFFGLSGTGKTTLSTDPGRFLIGDDEHGWSENGIFNFEGGCYAKCINLKKESEPQIWNAVKHGSLLENVSITPDGDLDFNDCSVTENTRATYPIEFIENSILSGMGGHPSCILFLTADATGVLPPVARLSIEGAMYHFLSGYTSKLAGTERGIKEPKATFSSFFGAPFMPLKPMVYAGLLKKYIVKHKTSVYLVNTGWTGGPYGVGKRISIKDTRGIVSSIMSGDLEKSHYRRDTFFNLDIPISMKNVPKQLLNPRSLWVDKKAYDASAHKLAALFVENFKKFGNLPKRIINSGPLL